MKTKNHFNANLPTRPACYLFAGPAGRWSEAGGSAGAGKKWLSELCLLFASAANNEERS